MIFQAFRKLLTNPIISKIPKGSSDHEVFLARNDSVSAAITVRFNYFNITIFTCNHYN